MNISLLTQDGEEIYSESIQPAIKRHRKYNLELLPKGNYKLVVSDDLRTVTYAIEIAYGADIEVSEGKTSFIPQVSLTEDKIDINLLAQNEKVRISLYDNDGNNLYYENINNSMVVEKRLDISNLDNGDYTLSMYVGDRWYNNTFEK